MLLQIEEFTYQNNTNISYDLIMYKIGKLIMHYLSSNVCVVKYLHFIIENYNNVSLNNI